MRRRPRQQQQPFFVLRFLVAFALFCKSSNSFVYKNNNKWYGRVALNTEEERATTIPLYADRIGRVVLIAGSAPSDYGSTSPEPNPSWKAVADQLALRLPHFAGVTSTGEDKILTKSILASQVQPHDLQDVDVVVALGISDTANKDTEANNEESNVEKCLEGSKNTMKAFLADPTCSTKIRERQFAGSYQLSNRIDDVIANIIPWSSIASGKRLLGKTETLLARKSSEDYIFSLLFCLQALVMDDLDVVKSDINPSWEKGPIRNIQEFAKMADCCGPQIYRALSHPPTKKAIDLLNAVGLRDQVGSYRIIVSNETPQLEEFTLCILQQNNCFRCDSPILTRPQVPLIQTWQNRPLDAVAAKQILIGHLNHPEAATCSQNKPWSWKIVVGANPAYDAFPMQHQIFYPSDGSQGNAKKTSKSLWYDPVFCVETLDGELVWCKRHYRCTPRTHWSGKDKAGAWTLSTLDNGMVSEEHWTTVDAADDLSWAVLHYSGAARCAGQSYVGALLCSPDGLWPSSARNGPDLERIRQAFRACDLELWELFGGSTDKSFMWSKTFTSWAEQNPPPLEQIGDISITRWREQERKKTMTTESQ